MSLNLSDKFSKLFDDSNEINENIVAMTFLMLESIPLNLCVIIFCIVAGCINGCFNGFHTSAIIIAIVQVVNKIIALLFKAHEQGTLTGEQLVNSISSSVSELKIH